MNQRTRLKLPIALALAVTAGLTAGPAYLLTRDSAPGGWTSDHTKVLDVALVPMIATGRISTERADCAKAHILKSYTYDDMNVSFTAAKTAVSDAITGCQWGGDTP